MGKRKNIQIGQEGNDGGLNELAGCLLKMIAKEPTNSVISPSCLYQTLAFVSTITSGDAKRQIENLIGRSSSVRPTLSAISEIEAPGYDGCKDFHYSTGASIWLDESVKANDLSHVTDSFPIASVIEQLPLDGSEAKERMGRWLDENTGGTYSQAPEMGAEALLAIMGAMHLKDSWSSPFDEDEPRMFQTDDGAGIEADFMFDWDHYDVLDSGRSVTLSKDLTSGCRLYASLPPEGCSLQDYVSSGEAWKNISANIKGKCTEVHRECKIYMPRFELTSDGVDLKEFLSEEGVTRLFEPSGDFGPISTDDLMVDSVLQNTNLKIDEEGLEGASYVCICCVGSLPPECRPEPREIVFDRPFAIAVTSPGGSPLFVGTVERPNTDLAHPRI